MIKVAVLYPSSKKFDWDYYLNKHTPLIQKLLGQALKKVEIEKGITGGAPGTAATYQTVCTLHFDSVAAFQAAFAPCATDHGRYRQLHRRAAGGADRRSEDVTIA
jgi:uncharacterized protein (TIGR02118 family)